jgi:hypothetical protein
MRDIDQPVTSPDFRARLTAAAAIINAQLQAQDSWDLASGADFTPAAPPRLSYSDLMQVGAAIEAALRLLDDVQQADARGRYG